MLDRPYLCSFLTAPAVGAWVVLERDPRRRPEIRAAMWEREEQVLAIAALGGHDEVVLGAWGCGVSGNAAQEVAGLFRNALEASFRGVSSRVTFAILNWSGGRAPHRAVPEDLRPPDRLIGRGPRPSDCGRPIRGINRPVQLSVIDRRAIGQRGRIRDDPARGSRTFRVCRTEQVACARFAEEEATVVTVTEKERTRLRGMIRRTRSRKEYFRARALLALADGRPIEEVARTAKVGVEWVEVWVDGFARLRLAYLAESDGPRPRAGQDEDEQVQWDE